MPMTDPMTDMYEKNSCLTSSLEVRHEFQMVSLVMNLLALDISIDEVLLSFIEHCS